MPHTVNKILLLDDDPEDVDILEMALEEAFPEIQLSVAWDDHALSMLINTPYVPDLILMDLNMPLKLGKECLTEIRSSTRYSKIPVVILSPTDHQVNIEYWKENGVQKYYKKPTSFTGTVKLVTDLCNGNY